jgi:hypothetical protein
MFDITKLSAVDTAPLHLKGPSGELLYADEAKKKPVRVIVYGPSSAQYSIIEARQSERALKRYADNDGKVVPASPDERRAEAAEDLATITQGFENFAYPPAGEAQGVELFAAVYGDRRLGFITNQVNKFAADWGNFTKKSAGS